MSGCQPSRRNAYSSAHQRHHRSEFREAERSDGRDQAAHQPDGQDQARSVDPLRDIGGVEEYAGTDDAADNQERGIEQVQTALQRRVIGEGFWHRWALFMIGQSFRCGDDAELHVAAFGSNLVEPSMSRTVNRRKVLGAAAMILASASPGLFAQWPAYPTAGVPKAADGKPDLTGPAQGRRMASRIFRESGDSSTAPMRGPGLRPRQARDPPASAYASPDCFSFLTSAPRSRMVCPSSRGRRSSGASASRKTTRIIPTPTVCRSA